MNCKNDPVTVPPNESVPVEPEPEQASSSISPTMGQHLESVCRFLPESFHPGGNEVILGRGKQIASHTGNKVFKQIVLSHAKEYSAAQTKALKSCILSHIVNKIRAKSAFQAGFVKQDASTGRWMIAEDSAARIATAQIFRDALHGNYKSSKAFKQQRREDRKGVALRRASLEQGVLMQPEQPHPPTLPYHHQQSSHFAPLVVPTNTAPRTTGNVQDAIVGQLNSVIEQLKGGTAPSSSTLASMLNPRQLDLPPNKPEPQQDVLTKGEQQEDVVSLLENHLAIDTSSNPFEPRPISEDAIVFNTKTGFRLREPFDEDSL